MRFRLRPKARRSWRTREGAAGCCQGSARPYLIRLNKRPHASVEDDYGGEHV